MPSKIPSRPLTGAQLGALEPFNRGYSRLARLGAMPLTGGRKSLQKRIDQMTAEQYGHQLAGEATSCPLAVSAEALDFPQEARFR